ncbi:MAG TPA: hypothetical protein VGG64_19460 [Pirellulales bacterium]
MATVERQAIPANAHFLGFGAGNYMLLVPHPKGGAALYVHADGPAFLDPERLRKLGNLLLQSADDAAQRPEDSGPAIGQ